jgi:hypothetical protein
MFAASRLTNLRLADLTKGAFLPTHPNALNVPKFINGPEGEASVSFVGHFVRQDLVDGSQKKVDWKVIAVKAGEPRCFFDKICAAEAVRGGDDVPRTLRVFSLEGEPVGPDPRLGINRSHQS